MNTNETQKEKPAGTGEAKPGFFKRVFTKLDQSMKEQATKKAKDTCCGGNDGKGGKCC